MGWLYDMLINSGVASDPASWCVVGVVLLCVYSIFRAFIKLIDL